MLVAGERIEEYVNLQNELNDAMENMNAADSLSDIANGGKALDVAMNKLEQMTPEILEYKTLLEESIPVLEEVIQITDELLAAYSEFSQELTDTIKYDILYLKKLFPIPTPNIRCNAIINTNNVKLFWGGSKTINVPHIIITLNIINVVVFTNLTAMVLIFIIVYILLIAIITRVENDFS